jgi:hypothetical protein
LGTYMEALNKDFKEFYNENCKPMKIEVVEQT